MTNYQSGGAEFLQLFDLGECALPVAARPILRAQRLLPGHGHHPVLRLLQERSGPLAVLDLQPLLLAIVAVGTGELADPAGAGRHLAG